MHIATLTRDADGYSGRVHTLMLDAAIVLTPIASDAENAPAFRIHLEDADGPEIGAAWAHTGDKAGDYLAPQIDDPTFAQPIRANLFQADDKGDDTFVLSWNRPSRRDDRAER